MQMSYLVYGMDEITLIKSLIIYEEKEKVWKCDLNYHKIW